MYLLLHPHSVLLALSALISGVIALLVWRKRTVQGAISLGALMVELGVWAGANAVMWASSSLEAHVFWLRITYLGVLATPLTFLIFIMQITDNDRWLTRRNVLLLCIEPLVTLLLLWTNEFHHLIYSSFDLITVNGLPELRFTHGPWFWVNVAYSYVIIFVAFAALLRSLVRAAPYFRAQLLTIFLGSLIPWAVNGYALFISHSPQYFDLTPMSFGASGMVFAYALLNQRLLDILPIARGMLIEKMGDGMLVIDIRGRILDINPAAQGILHMNGNQVFGRNIREVYPQWMDYIENRAAHKDLRFEIRGRIDPSRFYDITITPLVDSRGRDNGRLISFRDVTDRKFTETELHAMNTRLQRQLRKIGELRDDLREQAIRDPLTDLFNRRYLTETLERELDRAKREGYPVSVIMMDVDRFKTVNDTHGHKAGDRALKILADTIRRHIRGSDIPCRFGGEEFVIVLPETALETAAERAEHIRTHFQSTKIFPGKSATTPTLSMGVAVFPTHAKHAESLLHAADQAMYAAKATGNAVMPYKTRPSKKQHGPGSRKKRAAKTN